MNVTHTISARIIGVAMRAVAGICRIGRISGRLQRKMKRKRLRRNGVQLRPSLPIVCMTMPSSTNSTDASATLRTPLGATMALRLPATQ